MLNCGVKIYKQEGPAALYKGLTPFIAQLVSKYALRFGIFSFFQNLLGAGKDPHSKADSVKTFSVSALRPALARSREVEVSGSFNRCGCLAGGLAYRPGGGDLSRHSV